MIKLGDKIRELRQNLGLTQEELAEGICTRSYISVLENNQMTPSDDVINKLSQKLGFDLRSIKDSFHPSSPYKDELNRIENFLYHQDYSKAMQTFREIPLDAELPPEERAKWLWERGTLIALEQHKWDEGLVWCKEALELLQHSTEHTLMAKIYHLKGIFEYHLGMVDEAFQSYLLGIEEMSKSESPSTRYLISLYVNLALIHNLWDEPHSALIYLKKAKEQNKKAKAFYHAGEIEFQWGYANKRLGNLLQAKKSYSLAEEFFLLNEENENLGSVYTNLGIIERELGNYNESLSYLRKAVGYFQNRPFQDKLHNSNYELALTLTKLEKWDEALSIALELIQSLSEGARLLTKLLLLLGDIYFALNNNEQSEHCLLQAFNIVEKSDHVNAEIRQSILKRLMLLYRLDEKRNLYLEKLLKTIP